MDPPTFVGHSRLRSAKAEALAKEGASVYSAEEVTDLPAINPGMLHLSEQEGEY